ncbi:SUKH-3 domain-containing protein [Actinoplanes sp. NPDC051859]|uniref:SUKH-3 domain-containing protein n=1 Tax=Actinoplanes sp. NPDC051859 TaxID=3363909 RepID=UPI003788288F
MDGRFPRGVDRALRKSGWIPGRTVDASLWRECIRGIEMHVPAERFLTEFGGLSVNIHGLGRSAAKAPFELDPGLCEGEEERFRDWSNTLGRVIYPLGELDHGRFFLGMDELGEIFLVADWLASFGSGDAGLIALCQGVMPTEMHGAP